MDILTQQLIAMEVLHKIKARIDERAIIAGGAPRNWDEGKLAVDIDVYYRSNCACTIGYSTRQIEACLGSSLEFYEEKDCVNYASGKYISIRRVLSFVYKGQKIQCIVVDDNNGRWKFAQNVVDHIDLGINKIYADWFPERQLLQVAFDLSSNSIWPNLRFPLTKTDAYKKDRANKTLTLYADGMSTDQLKHCLKYHLPKMRMYYPDYTVVADDAFVQLVSLVYDNPDRPLSS